MDITFSTSRKRAIVKKDKVIVSLSARQILHALEKAESEAWEQAWKAKVQAAVAGLDPKDPLKGSISAEDFFTKMRVK